MRIMVFDVPAESGGALSVLHEFYNEFKLDRENEYIFVLSLPELKETSNIKVLRFPWIKKGWGQRLYFDHFIAPKLISKYKVDRVLSLQNIMIPHTKVYQSVFVHNALPFSEYRFSIFKNRLLWVYQNIISRSIFSSIRRADRVIVQTNWMRDICVEKLNINSDKVDVIPPKLEIEVNNMFLMTKESLSTFFYPASGVFFKNHSIVIDACLKLKEEGVTDYKVIFTINGDENKHIEELYTRVQENQLPVEFIGSISRDRVYDYYTNSILLFPSFIETVGLPLLEAQFFHSPIIAIDLEYSKSVLKDYTGANFFRSNNCAELSVIMRNYINYKG